MTMIELFRELTLLIPLVVTVVLLLLKRPQHFEWVGALFSFIYLLPTLFLANLFAIEIDWWHYQTSKAMLFGVPFDLILAWAIFWGPLVFLFTQRFQLIYTIPVLIIIDALSMPLLFPIVQMSDNWLYGEVFFIIVCFIPAQLLARWTAARQKLFYRASFLAIAFATLAYVLLPSAIMKATAGNWQPAFEHTLIFYLLFSMPFLFVIWLGLSGVREFALTGEGTALPLDPPIRLVNNGVYAYVGNPQQLSATLSWLLLGFLLENIWVGLAAIMSVIFCEGYVRWHQDHDLLVRFPDDWKKYKQQVSNWFPRWRPYVVESATLYIARDCLRCQIIRRWIELRRPTGIQVIDAEHHPERDLEWITYRDNYYATEVEGWDAIARALGHINLAWAVIGWIMVLPPVRQIGWWYLNNVFDKPLQICTRESCKNE